MKYMGSKNRHAKELLAIMLKDRKPDQFWVEPFVGGCNMIDKVSNPRIANDWHPHLIAMWKEVAKGWEPPSQVSEELYALCRSSHTVNETTGFVGFGASYSGKWFGGYARGDDANGNPRNYADESRRNILRQAPKLNGVEFYCGSYDELKIPSKSLVYCDPPYQGTTEYKTVQFDYEKFWNWCRYMKNIGHTVFVSEYSAPDDFECVWEKRVNNSLTKQTGSKQGVEKLFRGKSC